MPNKLHQVDDLKLDVRTKHLCLVGSGVRLFVRSFVRSFVCSLIWAEVQSTLDLSTETV